MAPAPNKAAVIDLLQLYLQDGVYRVVVEDDGSLRIVAENRPTAPAPAPLPPRPTTRHRPRAAL